MNFYGYFDQINIFIVFISDAKDLIGIIYGVYCFVNQKTVRVAK